MMMSSLHHDFQRLLGTNQPKYYFGEGLSRLIRLTNARLRVLGRTSKPNEWLLEGAVYYRDSKYIHKFTYVDDARLNITRSAYLEAFATGSTADCVWDFSNACTDTALYWSTAWLDQKRPTPYTMLLEDWIEDARPNLDPDQIQRVIRLVGPCDQDAYDLLPPGAVRRGGTVFLYPAYPTDVFMLLDLVKTRLDAHATLVGALQSMEPDCFKPHDTLEDSEEITIPDVVVEDFVRAYNDPGDAETETLSGIAPGRLLFNAQKDPLTVEDARNLEKAVTPKFKKAVAKRLMAWVGKTVPLRETMEGVAYDLSPLRTVIQAELDLITDGTVSFQYFCSGQLYRRRNLYRLVVSGGKPFLKF